MKFSPNGVAVAHYYENCKLKAYPDPGSKDGKPWTIGWGHTGKEVVPGLEWTQKQADDQFLLDVVATESAVAYLVKVPVTQGQFDALVDFAYNVGAGNLTTSTLLRLLNAKDYAGARAQFSRWNKNDGKEMKGLTRRRASEVALWDGLSGAEAITKGVKAA